jgi:hypothetical protein
MEVLHVHAGGGRLRSVAFPHRRRRADLRVATSVPPALQRPRGELDGAGDAWGNGWWKGRARRGNEGGIVAGRFGKLHNTAKPLVPHRIGGGAMPGSGDIGVLYAPRRAMPPGMCKTTMLRTIKYFVLNIINI